MTEKETAIIYLIVGTLCVSALWEMMQHVWTILILFGVATFFGIALIMAYTGWGMGRPTPPQRRRRPNEFQRFRDQMHLADRVLSFFEYEERMTQLDPHLTEAQKKRRIEGIRASHAAWLRNLQGNHDKGHQGQGVRI